MRRRGITPSLLTPPSLPPSSPYTAGMRRRGITPVAINTFCREIGITRNENIIPMHKLEHHIRLDLDVTSPRTMAVLRPLRVRAAGRGRG